MKREIEEDGDGHHSTKLREAVTVGKVRERVDSEEHREDSGRIEGGGMQVLAMAGRGDRGKERFGMGCEDWLLKDREATQTGAGEYEATQTGPGEYLPAGAYTHRSINFLINIGRWWRVYRVHHLPWAVAGICHPLLCYVHAER